MCSKDKTTIRDFEYAVNNSDFVTAAKYLVEQKFIGIDDDKVNANDTIRATREAIELLIEDKGEFGYGVVSIAIVSSGLRKLRAKIQKEVEDNDIEKFEFIDQESECDDLFDPDYAVLNQYENIDEVYDEE